MTLSSMISITLLHHLASPLISLWNPSWGPYSRRAPPTCVHTQQLLLLLLLSTTALRPGPASPNTGPPDGLLRPSPTHVKNNMQLNFHWDGGREGVTLDLGLAKEAWGGGVNVLSFLPNDNGIFIISEN